MPPPSYHHGDLPNALRAAAADLLAEQGVAGFSLREVARRADVSHAAPAHHFGDAAGLLTSVAIEGFTHLTARTRASVEGIDDPVEALEALGRAYVAVAAERPGHCAVLFRKDVLRAGDAEYRAAGEEAFSVLVEAVQRLADARSPALDVLLASQLCWAAMQGLVGLYPTMSELGANAGLEVPAIDVLAERFTALMVAGLVPGG